MNCFHLDKAPIFLLYYPMSSMVFYFFAFHPFECQANLEKPTGLPGGLTSGWGHAAAEWVSRLLGWMNAAVCTLHWSVKPKGGLGRQPFTQTQAARGLRLLAGLSLC